MEAETKKRLLEILKNTGITLLVFALCTGLCYFLDYFKINDLNFLIIYVLGILLTAVFTKGFAYSSLLSVVSVFGYNFFFTIPRFTFHFNDKMYMVTFILMFLVGLGISTVTFQLKRKMEQVSVLGVERIKLKSAAEKEQLKATLLRSISHDLRTPLTTIKNGAELLLDNPRLEEGDKEKILGDIVSKSDWTIRLVENLLSLTRIDSEKLTVKKSPEALEEILPQAVRNVSGKLGTRALHYDVPEEMLLVPMDATLILQVIGNILDNAAKHTPPEGNIWIKVWNTGKNAGFPHRQRRRAYPGGGSASYFRNVLYVGRRQTRRRRLGLSDLPADYPRARRRNFRAERGRQSGFRVYAPHGGKQWLTF